MKVNIEIDGEYSYSYTLKLGDDDETEIELKTLVTFDPDMVDSWIDDVLSVNHCRLERLIVGLAINEWNPRCSDRSLATIQLCVGRDCLVYQNYRADYDSKGLKAFLTNQDFTFVGVGIEEDAEKIWEDSLIMVAKTRDLRQWAAEELGMFELWDDGTGLKRLAKEVVGVDLDKPRRVAYSRWNSRVLSRNQIAYACLDAYFSFEVARRLSMWY